MADQIWWDELFLCCRMEFLCVLLLSLFSGTLPVITYALVKINGTCLFVCNATGLPSPHVTIYKVISDTKHVIMAYHTPISDDTGHRTYYCVAQNDFGVSFSKHVNINGTLQNTYSRNSSCNKCSLILQPQTYKTTQK